MYKLSIGEATDSNELVVLSRYNLMNGVALYVRHLYISPNSEFRVLPGTKLRYGTLTIGTGGVLVAEPEDVCQVNLPPEAYDLTVVVNPTEGGTVTGAGINCPGDCTETYDTIADVTLTAAPAVFGYRLDTWQGGVVGSGDSVTMDADKAVKAVFTQLPPPNKKKSGELDDPVNTANMSMTRPTPIPV